MLYSKLLYSFYKCVVKFQWPPADYSKDEFKWFVSAALLNNTFVYMVFFFVCCITMYKILVQVNSVCSVLKTLLHSQL